MTQDSVQLVFAVLNLQVLLPQWQRRQSGRCYRRITDRILEQNRNPKESYLLWTTRKEESWKTMKKMKWSKEILTGKQQAIGH